MGSVKELLAILFATGVVGGVTAWLSDLDGYRSAKNIGSDLSLQTPRPSFFSYFAGGLVAAFTVPLFLRLTGSDLVDHVLGSPGGKFSDPWVVAGFCLVAAFSSKAFMQGLTKRILTLAQEAKREASEAKEQVQKNEQELVRVDELVENEPDPPTATHSINLSKVPGPSLTEDEKLVLGALTNSTYRRRTVSGIAKELKLPKPWVDSMLQVLVQRNLLAMEISKKSGNKLYYVVSN